jgi:lipopolysaccharide transport system ATP-binding protein
MQGMCSKCFLLKGGKLVMEGAPRAVIEQYMAGAASGAATQLAERQDRQGTGEIRMEAVITCDEKGRPIDNALCGQNISFAVSYRSRDDKPIARLDMHIAVYTTVGHFMFNCASEASGHRFDVLPPKGQLVCHIPELPLAPGRYVFNLYSTVGGVVADWVQQAGVLNVVTGDYYGTGQLKTHNEGFLVKHKWTTHSPA